MFTYVCQFSNVQMILQGITDPQMSTGSLSVLFLCWLFIILHISIIKKLGKLFYIFLFFCFCLKYKHYAEQTVYKHTEVQHYSICILICFLDKWLLATSIIQKEKQWKYRGIAFVYFFLSCQSFLIGFYINIKKSRKSSSLKASVDKHILYYLNGQVSQIYTFWEYLIHASVLRKQHYISFYTIRLCLCKIHSIVQWKWECIYRCAYVWSISMPLVHILLESAHSMW